MAPIAGWHDAGGVIALEDRSQIVPCIVNGFADMVCVNLVIALAMSSLI